MNIIFFVLIFSFLFSSTRANNVCQETPIQFSMIEDKSMEEFEKKIAYFFGVSNEEPVANDYINALRELEKIGSKSSLTLLEQKILPYFESAYKEVARQRNFEFDIHKAATIELKVLLANANCASFETIQNLAIELYTLIFKSDSLNIRKAAMLRTFLFQYKLDVLKKEGKISKNDQKTMISLAKTSEEYLNSIK